MKEQERANKVMSPMDTLTEAQNKLNRLLKLGRITENACDVEEAVDKIDLAINQIQEINYSMLRHIQQLTDENYRLKYRMRKIHERMDDEMDRIKRILSEKRSEVGSWDLF